MSEEIKRCPGCEKYKSISEYCRNVGKPTGRTWICKECANARYRIYHAANREKIKVRVSEYHKLNPDARARVSKVSRKRNPYIIRVRKRFAYAVATGKIVKPDQCEHCQGHSSVQGHHPDYSKPYEVIWLCQQCHMDTHRLGVT